MADNETTVMSLLNGAEFKDSRIFDALSILAGDMYDLHRQINPPTTKSFGTTGQLGSSSDITSLTGTLSPTNLHLSWDAIDATTTYKIKYGTVWATANELLTTSSAFADLNPITIPLTIGTHTFLIKSITGGVEGDTAASFVLTISQASAPAITPTVIDNNVLLYWTVPISQLAIAYYNVFKSGVNIGTMNGTFEAIFETAGGTFTYGVQAVDIVGNVSVTGTIIIVVSEPPDYELQDSRTSAFTGTKTNVKLESSYLVCCYKVETWQQHFVNNGWASPQAQVTAGYPYYIQPTNATGSYEEVIDYGVLLSNTIVTMRWSETQIVGTVTVVPKIATSVDNITYTAFTAAPSAFFASLRYVKIRFEFTGSNDHALLKFSNLQILLDVKREIDSGSGTAVKTDVNGTEVFFNKTFKDIDSITVTAEAKEPVTIIKRFVDAPNPTSFFVYAFSSTGNRLTQDFSWKARGIT